MRQKLPAPGLKKFYFTMGACLLSAAIFANIHLYVGPSRPAVPLLPAAAGSTQNSYVNFEGKQTSPVRLSADGARLFAVNTPDARVSVFDISFPSNPALIAEIPVGVEPVSVNPRTTDEAWVVNEVSDSVSIVSGSRHAVVDTIHVPDDPADVSSNSTWTAVGAPLNINGGQNIVTFAPQSPNAFHRLRYNY